MIIPNIWKNKKCSKPPTSYIAERCWKECGIPFGSGGWMTHLGVSSKIWNAPNFNDRSCISIMFNNFKLQFCCPAWDPRKPSFVRHVAEATAVLLVTFIENEEDTWLVLSTPLKNMSSSLGMMTFPIFLGKEKNVPVTSNQIHGRAQIFGWP